MKKILVTGSSGFIGKNLTVRLEQAGYEVFKYDRETVEPLGELVEETDFIFHIAGINRPKDEKEFKTGNQDLTETIISHAKKHRLPIVITSSIQASLDNPYGKSKRGAESLLRDYEKTEKANVYIFRLPNVFGKWSRPNYNSVVATFCHNISHDIPLQINDPDSQITLVYIDEVIDEFLKCITADKAPNEEGFCEIPNKYTTTVGELAGIIESLHEMRTNQVVPDLSNRLTKYLYATLTSFYDEDYYASEPEVNTDERGWLFELIKSDQSGQVFVSKTKPGYTRGQHWHHTKVERFCVIDGEGEISFRKLGSQDIFNYQVSDKKIQVIDVPVGYVHSIKNTGQKDMLLIIWANEILDKNNPDTYYEEV